MAVGQSAEIIVLERAGLHKKAGKVIRIKELAVLQSGEVRRGELFAVFKYHTPHVVGLRLCQGLGLIFSLGRALLKKGIGAADLRRCLLWEYAGMWSSPD